MRENLRQSTLAALDAVNPEAAIVLALSMVSGAPSLVQARQMLMVSALAEPLSRDAPTISSRFEMVVHVPPLLPSNAVYIGFLSL